MTVYSVPFTSSVTVLGMMIEPDKSVPDVVPLL